MLSKAVHVNRLATIKKAAKDTGFSPDGYLAGGLARVFRVGGMGMYQLLNLPASRAVLVALCDRMQHHWRQAEQTGRWAAFRRAVDRLARVWMDLLGQEQCSANTSAKSAG